MNGRTTFLGLLLCAMLACGDAKNLSVGQLRCEGVSCAPTDVEWATMVGLTEIKDVERGELLVPTITPSFCSDELPSLGSLNEREPGEPFCKSETMIAIGDREQVLATRYATLINAEQIETGLRLARFKSGVLEWENTELSREVELESGISGDAFAIASGDAPEEVILGVTRETGEAGAYGQTFYVLTGDGELRELFKDEQAGRIRALAAFGADLIVVSDYEQRLEVTRYTAQGKVVWRQTTLAVVPLSRSGPTALEFAAVRVVDDERIIVLTPRATLYELLELTAEGAVARIWTNWGYDEEDYYQARLVVGAGGQVVTGADGYLIERASFVDGEPQVDTVTKDRTQYYTPTVQGLYVDHVGYIYVATIDGVRDRRTGLLERISPDLSRRESFVLSTGSDAGFEIAGDLFVTEDQRTLYFAAGGTVASIELPPIED